MIALLGSSGYVGGYFKSLFAREGLAWKPIRRADLYDADRLRAALREAGADWVINCAGFTGKPNVDACELQKTDCLLGNGVLPGIIRAACESLEIPWGHVSSGCIFTGRRADGAGFTEADPPNFSFRQNNCSFYSGTKALGEEVLEGAEQCYIWRLRIPFENTANPQLPAETDQLSDAARSGEFAVAARRVRPGLPGLFPPAPSLRNVQPDQSGKRLDQRSDRADPAHPA